MSTRKIFSLLLVIVALCSCSGMRISAQKFASPGAALTELEQAVTARSVEQINRIFGEEGDYLLDSGDPVLDAQRARKFAELFAEGHELVEEDDGTYTVVVGNSGWPFPVPLRKSGGKWYFDAEAGHDVILLRRIGRNELGAIQVARIIYTAQREYALSGVNEGRYASNIISTPGSHDGLYWDVVEGEPMSPLGPAIARAADENYSIVSSGAPQPYRGYLFKIHYSPPVSGADVLERPGKYWLIASPVSPGNTGVMTFAANERGWIYQKDLGEKAEIKADQLLNISSDWTRRE